MVFCSLLPSAAMLGQLRPVTASPRAWRPLWVLWEALPLEAPSRDLSMAHLRSMSSGFMSQAASLSASVFGCQGGAGSSAAVQFATDAKSYPREPVEAKA